MIVPILALLVATTVPLPAPSPTTAPNPAPPVSATTPRANGALAIADAIAEAASRNTGVLVSVQEVAAARARRTQVASSPLRVQAGVSSAPDVPGGLGTLASTTDTLNQEFGSRGNLAAARSQGDAGIAAAEARLDAVRLDVALRTTTAYYALASAQAAVDVSGANVSATRELLRTAQLRQRAGAVGGFEVLRATVELRRVTSELLHAQAMQTTARVALNVLLGRDAARTTEAVEPAPSSEAPAAADAARAYAVDPTARQLRAQAEEQRYRARAAAALGSPTLSVGAGVQATRAYTGGPVSVATATTVTLSIPILDHGTIRGAVAEADAERRAIEAQLAGRSIEVSGSVITASADLESAQTRGGFASDARRQAEEALRVAQFGFRQGALGALDVVSARNALAAARGEERQAAADVAAARTRLQLLLGLPVAS